MPPKNPNPDQPDRPNKEDVRKAEKARLILEARELARDFTKFFYEAWNVLYPDISLSPSWHYEYIAEVLQYAGSGQMKQDHPTWRGLIINVPPRTLKSTEVNIIFPCWEWASHPEKKFMCISYGAELAINEIATKRRKLLQDDWFSTRYAKVKIMEDLNLKHRWDTVQGGYMIATTPGGVSSGSGANIVIIDDIIKLDDAYSSERERNNKWYEQEGYSRLNNQAEDFFIVICQRLHEQDFPGYLLKHEPGLWWHVVIPLECEEDTDYVFPISGKVYHRKKGDILLPDRFPPHAVTALKKWSARWAGQYQQRPMPATGSLTNPNWWQYFESDEQGRPLKAFPEFEIVAVSVDCSFKGTQDSDFVCLQKWGFVANKGYLIECVNERLDMIATESAILAMTTHGIRTDVLLVEQAGNGQAIIDTFRRKGYPCTLVPIAPQGNNKLSRAMGVQGEVEQGNCVLPQNAPWLQEFIQQLALGPLLAENDDMIDAWSQAWNWRKNHRYGFFEALKEGQMATVGPKTGMKEEVRHKIALTEETSEEYAARRVKEQQEEQRKHMLRMMGR